MRGRCLFASVPKCGKNLVRSVLHGLGVRGVPNTDDLVDAARQTHTRWLRRISTSDDNPSVVDIAAQSIEGFRRTLASFEALGDGTFMHGHIAYDSDLHQAAVAAQLPIVFLYRDPRACLSSFAHYLVERGEPAELLPYLASRDVESAVRVVLALPFANVFAPYAEWRRAEGVLALRFEDLVGPRGGGQELRQRATVSALVAHIGWRGSMAELDGAVMGAFNPRAGTFRRGAIDGWRQELAGVVPPDDWGALDDLARAWGYWRRYEVRPSVDPLPADLSE